MLHLLSRGHEMIECDAHTAADGSIRVVIRYPDGRVEAMSLTCAQAQDRHWNRFVKRLTGENCVGRRGH